MTPSTFHLVSWNINARTNSERFLQYLADLRPDIIALQEVRPSILDELGHGFQTLGLNHFQENVTVAKSHTADRAQITASRWPIQQCTPMSTHYAYSVLSSSIDSPWGVIEFHNAHVPNGSNHGRVKMDTFEVIYQALGVRASCPRILCGDFNTPIAELPDGHIITSAYDRDGDDFVSWESDVDDDGVEYSANQWDTAERSVLCGLASFGLPDIFRLLNGYSVPAVSHHTRSGAAVRYDHIFAARTLGPIRCAYINSGFQLSDHAPIEAIFAPSLSAQ